MTCLPESLDAVVVTYSRIFAGGNEIAMDSQRIVRGDLHGSSDKGSFFRNKKSDLSEVKNEGQVCRKPLSRSPICFRHMA
jgi:hypothetical protein